MPKNRTIWHTHSWGSIVICFEVCCMFTYNLIWYYFYLYFSKQHNCLQILKNDIWLVFTHLTLCTFVLWDVLEKSHDLLFWRVLSIIQPLHYKKKTNKQTNKKNQTPKLFESLIQSMQINFIKSSHCNLWTVFSVSPGQRGGLTAGDRSHHQEHQQQDLPDDCGPGHRPAGGRQQHYTGNVAG